MKLYNSLTQSKEILDPLIPGKVSIYVCGPTIYDRPHIGNGRSVVVYDVLYRVLMHLYGKDNVKYIRNITDVDDKINARALELGISIRELTEKTYREFSEDMEYLNCLKPTYEPRATDHIKDIILLIQKLIDNNCAYVIEGHVYFDVTSHNSYGSLAGRDLENMISGVRIEVSQHKRHEGDFVLWKPSSIKDDISSVFDSPWGKGRPGWHIECSAMSMHFLGTDFDIHGGGADLIFPHHTNEIAQSECAFPGSKYARMWVHNGFLTINGQKMSKSLGNFVTLYDLMQKNIHGEVMRYLYLNTHYRKPLDFNDKAVYDAKENLDYLYRALGDAIKIDNNKIQVPQEFLNYLEDDMNISEAFAMMHEMAKILHKNYDSKIAEELLSAGRLLGLFNTQNWFHDISDIDEIYINQLLTERSEAKKSKNFALADEIRNKLKSMNIEVEDKTDGKTIWRKK